MTREPSMAATALAFLRDVGSYAGRTGVAAIALMVVGSVLEGAGLALLVPILAVLTDVGGIGSGGGWLARTMAAGFAAVGAGTTTARLGVLLGAFAALVGARAIVIAWRDRLMSDLQLGFVDRERRRIVLALAGARWSDIAALRHARVTHALSSEIGRVSAACNMVLQTAVSLTLLAAQTVLICLLSPTMAALGVATAVLGLLVLFPAARRATRMGSAISTGNFRMTDGSAQFLGGLKMAIAQNMGAAFAAENAADGAWLTVQLRDYQRYQTRLGLISTSVSALTGAAITFGGVAIGVPTVTLIASLAVLARMSGPVRGVQSNVQQFIALLPSYRTLGALRADLAPEGRIAGPATPLPPAAAIMFDAVGFTHPGGHAATLSDVSLTIAPGEVVGIVGASGAGKTSFVDLLAGLFEADTGAVRVGGVALTHANAAAWRARIAYVAQDPYLLNDSLRRNLTWGLGDVDDAALWAALDTAGARALVAAMPDGLDTVVAERGSRLSGGERQRIALARALVRDPELLILDEATNAIDIATEHAILDRIVAACPGMTIVLVAHRGESLRLCRRLLTFGDGRLEGDVALPPC